MFKVNKNNSFKKVTSQLYVSKEKCKVKMLLRLVGTIISVGKCNN